MCVGTFKCLFYWISHVAIFLEKKSLFQMIIFALNIFNKLHGNCKILLQCQITNFYMKMKHCFKGRKTFSKIELVYFICNKIISYCLFALFLHILLDIFFLKLYKLQLLSVLMKWYKDTHKIDLILFQIRNTKWNKQNIKHFMHRKQISYIAVSFFYKKFITIKNEIKLHFVSLSITYCYSFEDY